MKKIEKKPKEIYSVHLQWQALSLPEKHFNCLLMLVRWWSICHFLNITRFQWTLSREKGRSETIGINKPRNPSQQTNRRLFFSTDSCESTMQSIPVSTFKMEPKKIARILTQNNMNKELKVTAGFPPATLHFSCDFDKECLLEFW